MKTNSVLLKKNMTKEKFIFVLIFIFSVIVRFLIADFSKVITTYPDELRYFGIARSLFQGNGISYRGISFDFQKIAYSIILAPTFFIKNEMTRVSVIAFLNVTLTSLSIIPLLKISDKVNLTFSYKVILVIITLMNPAMVTSMSFMSENLYWLLVFSFIAIWLHSIQSDTKIIHSALGGIFCYFCYLCKEIAVSFVLAYITLEILNFVIFQRKFNKLSAKKLIVFILAFSLCYIIAKFSLFKNMGNSYNGILPNSLTAYNLMYMVYGFLVFLLGIMLYVLFLPILYPILNFKHIDNNEKQLFLLSLLTLIISAAIIAFTITVREDLGRINPRMHFRYIAPIFSILFLVFFRTISNKNLHDLRDFYKTIPVFTVVLVLFSFIFKGPQAGSPHDPLLLKWYEWCRENIGILGHDNFIIFPLYAIILNLSISLIVFLSHYLLYQKVEKGRYLLFFSTLIIFQMAIDSYLSGITIKRDYSISENLAKSGMFLVKKLKEKDGNILFISAHHRIESRFFETYFDDCKRLFFCREDDFLENAETREFRKISDIKFRESILLKPYKTISEICYIITLKDSHIEPLDGVFQSNLSNSYYNVYKQINTNLIGFKQANGRQIIFDNQFLQNGFDKEFVRYLNPDGFSFGPYWTVSKGNYTVTIEGENLDKAYIDIYSDFGKNHHPFSISEQNTNKIIIDFNFEKEISNTEFFVQNNSDKQLKMTSLVLKHQEQNNTK